MGESGTVADERRAPVVAIFVASLAGLLLEVAYTRIVSYKLWYYYTYLVIGLSLLGIGTGGVLVALTGGLSRWSTRRIVAVASTVGAASIAAGYLVVARLAIDTRAIWDYGTRASFTNLARLGVICFAVFASFIALGVLLSVLLGRAGAAVGRLYFADLAGAALACVVAVSLVSRVGPPVVVLVAALLFAGLAVWLATPRGRWLPGALAVVLVAGIVAGDARLPDIRVEAAKQPGERALYSAWGPVFRVDVHQVPDPTAGLLLSHDGTFGSGIHPFDGDPASQDRFETDPRATPFDILGDPPGRQLIIGSAGGNEILASLYRGATAIEAVELNPVTVGIVTDVFADYTGRLAERPEVRLTQGDGRSYLARSDSAYDLVWFVAPDSYAASNAASSGAFVLSESYLYTQEMIEESLRHLTDDGIVVVQFGELDVEQRPNRTGRYVITARAALEALGVEDPRQHMIVSAFLTETTGDLSTIVLKRTPFTQAEVARYRAGLRDITDTIDLYSPGSPVSGLLVSRLAAADDDAVAAVADTYDRDLSVVRDDSPFFWHFTPFGDVLRDITQPIRVNDPEEAVGERVLLLLLGVAIAYAAVFLLLPFVLVRRQWRSLPAKGVSGVYFACLGLGFMLFEITMIQRLVEFLGFPTYSLTVTLAAILVSTGLGALLSARWEASSRRAVPLALAALALLALLYRVGLDPLTDALLPQPLGVRVATAVALLVPLGLCLGLFMPLGLGVVGRLGGDEGPQYTAWAWAVNGFASVIGSVLTTILSMSIGFRAVQLLSVAIYAVAVVAFLALDRRARAIGPDTVVDARSGAGDAVGAALDAQPDAELLVR